MEINSALILAAGFGTRMGAIGKLLPKILWPIGNKTILEWQIKYLKERGIDKIYINSHHQHDLLLGYIKEKDLEDEVTVLYEEKILGVGGAILNLKESSLAKKGEIILINNGDQFLFFDKKKNMFPDERIAEVKAQIACIDIIEPSYNQTILKGGCLLSIEKEHNLKEDLITYAGFAAINLGKLEYKPGFINFFSEIANFKKEKVLATKIKNYEYDDFGTLSRYVVTMKRLLNKGHSYDSFYKGGGLSSSFEKEILGEKFSFKLSSNKALFEFGSATQEISH